MANAHGDFVWYELMTPDPEGAAAFYGPLTGWTIKPSEGGGPPGYRELWTEAGPVGGMLALTDEMTAGGAQPLWAGYVHVSDLVAQIEKLKAAGATILMGPHPIPGVGRFVFILDPQGVPLYVMQDTSGETSVAFAEHAPMEGHCAWNELITTDQEGAKSFYGGQFGWAIDGDMDMGPMGKYEFWRYGKDGGGMVGAVMTKGAEQSAPGWNYYFRVPDIDKAAGQVRASGGQIWTEPMEIPGGEYVINAVDPQGATFSLIGKKG